VLDAGRLSATPVARIGRIEALPGLRIVDAQGGPVAQQFAAFDHFQARA
jgi:thiamine-monophosphate kinase